MKSCCNTTGTRAPDPVSRSFYCSQSAGVALTSRYPPLLWTKNTQHLLSKQTRCQRSTREIDNRYPSPKFNTRTPNYSIKVKGRGGKEKNLLSSPSKAVTSASLSALGFIKQSHPAAGVIGHSKRGKTGKLTIILQLYIGKWSKITNVKRSESYPLFWLRWR